MNDVPKNIIVILIAVESKLFTIWSYRWKNQSRDF